MLKRKLSETSLWGMNLRLVSAGLVGRGSAAYIYVRMARRGGANLRMRAIPDGAGVLRMHAGCNISREVHR